MSTLQEQLQYAVDTKNLIRDAIKSKGIEISDKTVFRDYPEKIEEIQHEFTPEFTISPTGVLGSPIIKDTIIFPTEVKGQPASTTFSYNGTYETFFGVRRLVWPEYFLDVDIDEIISNNAQYYRTQEIDVSSVAVASSNIQKMRWLNALTLSKYSGEYNWRLLSNSPQSSALSLDLPEVTVLSSPDAGVDGHLISLSLNAPKAEILGSSPVGNTACFLHCTGTWRLPSVTDLRNTPRPQGDQTIYLPALQTQSHKDSMGYGSNTGIVHIYIGPNLTQIAGASNWKAHSAQVDVHIPAGNTTTKATLDAAGVSYTQDYAL